MSDKNWQTFLIALGFFLIAVSPLTHLKVINAITGLALILLGYSLLRKK